MIARVEASRATPTWTGPNVHGYFQPPLLDRDHLYVNNQGTITCLKFPSGETVWAARDPLLRLGIGGSMLRVDDDKLLLMSSRGRLSLAHATPSGVRLLAQAQAFEGTEIFATPLAYGGRLFAKGVQEFACFDLGGG
jgi:hypothetical protein